MTRLTGLELRQPAESRMLKRVVSVVEEVVVAVILSSSFVSSAASPVCSLGWHPYLATSVLRWLPWYHLWKRWKHTLSILELKPASEEVSTPLIRSAASLTMCCAASLSDRLTDRRIAFSASFSACLTSRLQRLPLPALFGCCLSSYCRRRRSCTISRGFIVAGISVSVDTLPALTGTKDD